MAEPGEISVPTGSKPPTMAGIVIVGAAMIIVLSVIEVGRRYGIPVPIPFLLIYGTVAIAAGLYGLRAGMLAATMAALFVIYSALVGFGPAALTGGVVQVLAGIAIAYIVGFAIGRNHDAMQSLITELKGREVMLADVREQLAHELEKSTDQLAGATTEVAKLRSRISSATRHSPAGVVVVDKERNIETVNEAAARMFGLVSLVQVRTDIDDFLAGLPVLIDGERAGGDHEGPLKAALLDGTTSDNVEIRINRTDGETRWLRGFFAPIRNDAGGIDGATIIFIDVTDKRRTAEKLQELSRRLIRVQEDERQYIARELHDEIGQHLTGIKMHLHAAAHQPENTELLDASIEKIDELMDVARNLSLELRPSVLDDLGLVAALRWYISRQALPGKCEISFDSEAATAELSPEAVTASFRIVQEAVTNAIRHSGADMISVRLYNEQDDFCVEIIDNGSGYTQSEHGENTANNGGFGLLFMRERVQELNGSLSIVTSPGNGTKVLARMPIQVAG
ncbi:MAG: PAS domain-containing protein [Woeseiaceae bacterium]|nr:PAS domain-containing protein [Woeseiaceae bacterium]